MLFCKSLLSNLKKQLIISKTKSKITTSRECTPKISKFKIKRKFLLCVPKFKKILVQKNFKSNSIRKHKSLRL